MISLLLLGFALSTFSRSTIRAGALDVDSDEAFWWIDLAGEHIATAWIGPNLEGDDGLSWRPWVMQCSASASEQPLVYGSSLLRSDGVECIGVEGRRLSVSLQPRTGQSWRSVRSQDDLEISVEVIAAEPEDSMMTTSPLGESLPIAEAP